MEPPLSPPLKPMQELILWRLLITGEEPMQSAFDRGHRDALVKAGYIRLEKRGRAKHVVLEDQTWDWMAERLRSPSFAVALPKRATTAIPVFETLLVRLGEYLRSRDLALFEFLQPQTVPPQDVQPTAQLENQIRAAYAQASAGQTDFRVRLAELRQHLAGCSTAAVDETLLAMQRAGKLALRPMEDPQEITPADERAAVDLGDGDRRYFVHLV